MDLLQLKYFKVVAKYEHISKAANELHIAQPSLSKMIGNLEKELSVPLFDRIGRNIKLNECGKSFLNRVNNIFIQIEDGKKELLEINELKESKVRLSINNLSPNLLKDFLEKYPNTSLKQTMGTLDEMRLQLLTNEIDIAISSQPIINPLIISYPLVTEEIFLVVSSKHNFSSLDYIDLKDASNENFISFNEGFGIRNLTEDFCTISGFEPNIILENNIITRLIELVDLNIGIALLPISKWSELPKTDCKFIHIKNPTCTRTIYLSHLDKYTLPKGAILFKDYITKYFNNI